MSSFLSKCGRQVILISFLDKALCVVNLVDTFLRTLLGSIDKFLILMDTFVN